MGSWGHSSGVNIAPVNHGKKALQALRKEQRNLSRKKRGSSNRRKAIRRVAKIQMRVANARKNFLHEQTTTIANNHGVVILKRRYKHLTEHMTMRTIFN